MAAGEAHHHRLDRRRRGDERRDPRHRGRLAAADRDVPAAARDPRRRGRARHDALGEERRPLPAGVRRREARDPRPRATTTSTSTSCTSRRTTSATPTLGAAADVERRRARERGRGVRASSAARARSRRLPRAGLPEARAALPRDRRDADALPRAPRVVLHRLVGQRLPVHDLRPKLGSLRDVDYDLAAIWNAPAPSSCSRRSGSTHCPQCWTPCEAYQSIIGNFLRPELPRRPRLQDVTEPS